jgi:hypothetical protein
MTEYDNTNRGSLFKNENKDQANPKDRDYSGSINIDGREFWLSAWIKTAKSGKKFMSIAVKPKTESTAKHLSANQRRQDADDVAF